ncbi:hypothetical protein GN244_ATG12172 [Phytophthora infestans]|nr:hypothetical protein GN244_ATG12172 [Phytophthora infestans]
MSQESKLGGEEKRWHQEGPCGPEKVEDEEVDSSYCGYAPQLMDTQEMQSLRMALDRGEMQILQQGHLREYVPRKTASNKLRQWYGLPRNHRGINRPVMSAGPSSHLESLNVSTRLSVGYRLRDRPVTSRRSASSAKAEEFAMLLKNEVHQVRELECRYEDSKRSLLEYMEIVSSCKPNDRVGGQEVYEQLADLISFADKCSGQE